MKSNSMQFLNIIKQFAKEQEIGSFYILKVIFQFAVQLKIANTKIELKTFFYCFSISLFKNRSILIIILLDIYSYEEQN
ncbi:unnamed protein product [Paramecium sonneborni]|uniref:Uncharacterized protein n=1 Tax=Paramecium sonneborni TaxID=65129 RepID=A0A8S1QMI8_9CILI|nr:unnamed protein product [Paramecium sonneborni]